MNKSFEKLVAYGSTRELHQKIRNGVGSNFLKELDIHIQKNWADLKCDDVSQIYWDFWNTLKPFKGNSNGFTGLSEYLIMRILLHKLGDWQVVEHSKDTRYFHSKDFRHLYVVPEYPFKKGFNKKKNRPEYVKPDIVICQSPTSPFKGIKRLLGIIEVKVYLTSGRKTVAAVFDKLAAIRKKHKELKALLLIFDEISNKPSSLAELKKKSCNDSSKWFSYCSLKETKISLSEVLEETLALPHEPD